MRRRTAASPPAGPTPTHATPTCTAPARGAAADLADRLRAEAAIRLEAWHDLAGDGLPEELLDIGEQVGLVDADQRDRVTLQPGATRAADPVDVVLGDRGQFVVHDVR